MAHIRIAIIIFIFSLFFMNCDRVENPGKASLSGSSGTPGIYAIIVDPGGGLVTNESLTTDTFNVRLSLQPSASVTIPVVSSGAGDEIDIDSTVPLVFDDTNWNINQTVTIVGVDDSLSDGMQMVSITLGPSTSGDANFANLTNIVTANNVDNEGSGSLVLIPNPNEYITNENGASTVIKLVLNKAPASDVTITGIASLTTTEAMVTSPSSPADLTFTTSDWSIPHYIVVQGQSDGGSGDEKQPAYINLGTVSTSDTEFASMSLDFNGADSGHITVYNRDIIELNQYSLYASAETYSALSSPTANIISFYDNDTTDGLPASEDGYISINFGFPFYYINGVYSTLVVYANGFVSFSGEIYTTDSPENQNLFEPVGSTSLENIIAPWWDDFDTGSGQVLYQVSGSEGSRILTIDWQNTQSTGGEQYNYQLKLYEGTDRIEFIYGTSSSSTSSTTASFGLKDTDSSTYIFYDVYGGTTSYDYSRPIGDYPANNAYYFEPPTWW